MSRRGFGGDEEQTPVDRPPGRPHQANERYIKTLGDAIPILAACNEALGEVLRELRLARHAVGQRPLTKVADVGAGLIKTGRLLRQGFRAG